MGRIMEAIRRKKIEPEIRKMWEKVMKPLEQVVEKRVQVFEEFAEEKNYKITVRTKPFDWRNLIPLELIVSLDGSEAGFYYQSYFFLPTNLDSKYYKDLKEEYETGWKEFCSEGGPFEAFVSMLPLKTTSEDRRSRLDSIIRQSTGYQIVAPLENLRDNASWKNHVRKVIGINYGIDLDYGFEIKEAFPIFPPWGGVRYRSTAGHGGTIPKNIDEFLTRNPDEDPQCLKENIELLERVCQDYRRFTGNKKVQHIFECYEENPIENAERIGSFLMEVYPNKVKQIVPYLIELGTRRVSEQTEQTLHKIFVPEHS